jgi:alpha-L-fucosidase 2
MLGVSFYGDPRQEQLDFTEKSFWTGRPGNDPDIPPGINPDARKSLPLIRKKIVAGEIALADSLTQNHFLGEYSRDFGSFSSIGSIFLDFTGQPEEYTSYHRELDLQNAVGQVNYQTGNTIWQREYFCSWPDKVFVMRISNNQQGSIGFRLSVKPVYTGCIIEARNDMLGISGKVPGDYMSYN